MGTFVDRTGQKVGNFEILRVSEKKNKSGSYFWVCKCSCGNIKEILGTSLFARINPTISCGCIRLKNLVGRIFGKLTVLNMIGTDKYHRGLCNCKCSCGNIKIISSAHLLNGNTISCGCSTINDLTNKTFGRLVVQSMSEKSNSKKNRISWTCKCSCGNITTVLACNLTAGHTTSCGCYNKEIVHKDLLGQTFGRLYVLDRVGTDSRGCILWKCECICGKIKIVPSSRLLNGDTKSCGCLTKEKSTERLQKNHRIYRISLGKDPDVLLSTKNKQLRMDITCSKIVPLIFQRDNYTCQLCGEYGKELNAHHIIPLSKDSSLAMDKTNLITLCRFCHIQSAHDGNFIKINLFVQKLLLSLIKKDNHEKSNQV